MWQVAAATESRWIIFWGTEVVLPAILVYTFYLYRIFGRRLRGRFTTEHQ